LSGNNIPSVGRREIPERQAAEEDDCQKGTVGECGCVI